ncbi:MAG TPA: ABC transporter permease [Candidatus Avoscillospira avicola]|uniref:ABC transporter permease n=1 Tax=Candidatus Avoscillospira avicola TaxID=2840706 RepID=A0A9D1DGW0_9FIRM|nr:ABC transporter permease [Candidatus Avoscillospira avicola]
MDNIFASFFTASFIALVIRVGTPLLFASMSAYSADIAGIPNIAVEGIMIFGALFGVYFSAISGSAWVGLLGVIGVGVLCALLIAFFTMKMRANPIMVGIALNLFAADFSIWLLLVWTGSKGTTASLPSKVLPTLEIPGIKDIPVLGTILSGHYFLTYVCILLAILLAILVYKTPFGLRMKACGLDAYAAQSVGIKVNRVRLIAIIMSGILAALGGAFLSMGYLSIFSNNMTASRGWIGIAANAVGQGNLLVVVLTTVVFAIAQGVVSQLALTALPSELINTIPYICVLLGLIFLSVKEYRKAKAR